MGGQFNTNSAIQQSAAIALSLQSRLDTMALVNGFIDNGVDGEVPKEEIQQEEVVDVPQVQHVEKPVEKVDPAEESTLFQAPI